jgi:hypothetical protein
MTGSKIGARLEWVDLRPSLTGHHLPVVSLRGGAQLANLVVGRLGVR